MGKYPKLLVVLFGGLLSGCVLLPRGTSTGDLAAVRGEPTLVLSPPDDLSGRADLPGALARDRAARPWDGGWAGATRSADLVHLEIDVTLDPERGTISGWTHSTLRALRPATNRLLFSAVDLEILEIVDGAGQALANRKRGITVEVTPEAPLARGDEIRVSVRFRGVPLRGYSSALTDGEAFAPEVFASAWPHGLSAWLPVSAAEGDLAKVTTTIRVGDGMSAIANGLLVEVAEPDDPTSGGARTFRWRTDRAIPMSAVAFAAGRYETFGTTAAETELFFHLPAGSDEAAAQRTFGESTSVLEAISDRLDAPFPFPRYDQVVVRDPDERTLDGATVTLMASDEITTRDDAIDDRRERPRRLVARGVLRKWFGAWIAPLEERHRWILDGLAMQLELDYEARVRGDSEVDVEWEILRERLVARTRAVLRGESELTRDERAERAAWALRSIRARLGEESYWSLVRGFASGDRGRLVTVEDFRRAGLDDLGVDLGPDLAQWSGRRSVPELAVRFQRRAVEGVGESIGVVVTQKQPGPLYRLEFPVIVHFEDGTRAERSMLLDRAETLMIVPIDRRVIDVSIDPEGSVLANFDIVKDDEAWLAQGALSRTSVERVRALPRLAELSRDDENARQALVSILLESPEPSVRERATSEIRFGGPAADLALQRLAADDPSPIVRRAAIHSLLQRYAQGRWEPSAEDSARLFALRQTEVSPGVLEELEELLATIP